MLNSDEIRKMLPFEHRTLRISDHDYRYIDCGRGDPILMVHGNPSWSFMFRNLIAGLSSTNRVIVPDHMGCGLSDKPQNYEYRLETHIDNLEELILHLRLESMTLLVHDWGGAIGMGLAARYPEKISRLIVCNSAAFRMSGIPFRISLCRIPWLGEVMIRDWNLFCKAAVHMTTVKKLPQNVKNAYLAPYDSRENRIAIYSFVKDIPTFCTSPSFPTLNSIENNMWMFREIPTLILWGMKDWCFTPRFLKRWLHFIPNAKVVPLENAGHWLFEDAPDEIFSNIDEFIHSDSGRIKTEIITRMPN